MYNGITPYGNNIYLNRDQFGNKLGGLNDQTGEGTGQDKVTVKFLGGREDEVSISPEAKEKTPLLSSTELMALDYESIHSFSFDDGSTVDVDAAWDADGERWSAVRLSITNEDGSTHTIYVQEGGVLSLNDDGAMVISYPQGDEELTEQALTDEESAMKRISFSDLYAQYAGDPTDTDSDISGVLFEMLQASNAAAVEAARKRLEHEEELAAVKAQNEGNTADLPPAASPDSLENAGFAPGMEPAPGSVGAYGKRGHLAYTMPDSAPGAFRFSRNV